MPLSGTEAYMQRSNSLQMVSIFNFQFMSYHLQIFLRQEVGVNYDNHAMTGEFTYDYFGYY